MATSFYGGAFYGGEFYNTGVVTPPATTPTVVGRGYGGVRYEPPIVEVEDDEIVVKPYRPRKRKTVQTDGTPLRELPALPELQAIPESPPPAVSDSLARRMLAEARAKRDIDDDDEDVLLLIYG